MKGDGEVAVERVAQQSRAARQTKRCAAIDARGVQNGAAAGLTLSTLTNNVSGFGLPAAIGRRRGRRHDCRRNATFTGDSHVEAGT